jgi:putative ATP-dependent endonuclease of the OLD family
MFERKSANVSKGRFAQALASQIQENKGEIEAPGYILDAIKHVCA